MPSPFPGMNPYFEQPARWPGFHTKFLAAINERLIPQVAPKYVVDVEEHIYIHDLPPEPRRLLGRADLSVARPEGAPAGQPALGVLEAPAPVELQLPVQDVERVHFLEVRTRQGWELVTVIELLSPSNKRGEDRRDDLAKRRGLLRSPANLVEIDLLRGGPPMPPDARPACEYSVLVSHAERRPAAAFWPIRLRDRLPVIPIPLRRPDEDARIDLQEILHRVYDAYGYADFIYAGSPDPPLDPEDEAWARQLMPRPV